MSLLGGLGAMRKEYWIDSVFRSAPARCVPLPDIPDRSLLLPTTRTNHDLIIVYKPKGCPTPRLSRRYHTKTPNYSPSE